VTSGRRLFTDTEVLRLEQAFIERCDRERWRLFALVTAPPSLSRDRIVQWRQSLGHFESAALYWPWLLAQPLPGAPVVERPPIGAVAGVFARRDRLLGPHAAPANERIADAVGLQTAISDEDHAALYSAGINVLRSFSGRGIVVWGARTLAWDEAAVEQPATKHVNVRRCLSAIERNVYVIGQREVFEPNGPLLWIRLSQSIASHLMTVYRSGALLGSSPAEAFFVRCDETTNPQESIDRGELLVEVGVAIAAPAEFIVFRMGRREGTISIQEVTR